MASGCFNVTAQQHYDWLVLSDLPWQRRSELKETQFPDYLAASEHTLKTGPLVVTLIADSI
jgi:hypothetical protein